MGDDPRAVYHHASPWLALTKAEKVSGVGHKPRRATHGLRRGVAGDVLAQTGDPKLALDFIGDDLRQAERYLKVRFERLDRAAAAIDGLTHQPSRNRHPSLQPSGADFELIAADFV